MVINTIAVIGAATLGREIASAALAAGYRTILEDVLPDRLAAAQAEIRARFERASASQPPAHSLKLLSTASSVALACREADLVMDTLPEETEMKIDVFCILEKFARPGAILATNAAKLSISEIAAVTTRAEHCVGLHFFDTAPKKNLLEIVRGLGTSDETVERCREVGRRMGREVVVVRESPVQSP